MMTAALVFFLLIAAMASTAAAIHFHEPKVSVHTFSDGEREVVFIEMVHVGSEVYYDRVRSLIQSEGTRGATYLYERITGGTPEQRRQFNAILGFPIDGTTSEGYSLIADLSGLALQPQTSFLNQTGRNDINADMTIPELLAEMPQELLKKEPKPHRPQETIAEFRKGLEELGAFDKNELSSKIIRYFIKTLFKFVLILKDMPFRKPGSIEKYLPLRDTVLFECVKATKGRVVITYGAAHFKKFVSNLRRDERWRYISKVEQPFLS